MHRKFIAPIIVSLALLLCLGAGDAKLTYLSPQSVDVVKLLPDPPSATSEEYQQEMEEVLKLQQTRSDQQIARGKAEAKFNVFAFSDVLGPWFTEQNCPKTAALFTQIEADSKYFTKLGKEHWNRPRPYVANEKVKPAAELEKEGSYPSGHSTRGMLMAEILAAVFPDKHDALLERGRQIGWDRVIIGVHYPSDVAAGRTLGQAMAQEMLKNKDFQQQLEIITAELTAAKTAQTSAQ